MPLRLVHWLMLWLVMNVPRVRFLASGRQIVCSHHMGEVVFPQGTEVTPHVIPRVTKGPLQSLLVMTFACYGDSARSGLVCLVFI